MGVRGIESAWDLRPIIRRTGNPRGGGGMMVSPTTLQIGWPCHMDALLGPSMAPRLAGSTLTQPLYPPPPLAEFGRHTRELAR